MTLKLEPPDEDHPWPYVIVKDWAQFAELLPEIQEREEGFRYGKWLFRGLENHTWRLHSGLYQALKSCMPGMMPDAVYSFEESGQEEFERWHVVSKELRGFGSEEENQIQRWVTMQHYGAPTRLVDWTRSPYVAAYFAVMSSSLDGNNNERDGSIWCFESSDLVDGVKKKYGNELSSEGVPCEAMKVNDNKFWGRGKLKTIDSDIFVVSPKIHTERMLAQQSVFTVCRDVSLGHEIALDKSEFVREERRLQIIIKGDFKAKLLEYLGDMNIHGGTLFPGPDGIGRLARERLRMFWGQKEPFFKKCRDNKTAT